MRKKHCFIHIASLALMLVFVCGFCAVTVFAEGEDDPPISEDPVVDVEPVPDEPAGDEPVISEPAADEPVYSEPEQTYEETPAQEYQEPLYEYIYGYSEDATSVYEEPKYLDELPEVTALEVVEATAVALPAVAVSDASVLSGIVMWLCVALGIAVIVGVLVSKRTRRRGV